MEFKQVQLIPRGMNQDLAISKFNPEFSYNNLNLRITARAGETLLSIQNEQGPALIQLPTIQGQCIGYATLNDYLILFTTQASPKLDRIYKIHNLTTVTLLAAMDMNFNSNYPISTHPLYETEAVQKVYFYDGLNQTRVINIAATTQPTFPEGFDFAPVLQLNDVVTITKNSLGGAFHSGVIQYLFTAFNPFGPETSPFYTSSLYYIGETNRAGAPDEICSNSFTIQASGLDNHYEYIRLYSIHRSSLNALPTVRLVGDFKTINNTIRVIDNGIVGSYVDPNLLLFLGAEDMIIKSMAIKDNTLFGGNIELTRVSKLDTLQLGNLSEYFQWQYRPPINIERLIEAESGVYTYQPYTLKLGKDSIAHYKRGQYYRYGIQAQHKTGKWSEPFYIGDDKKCTLTYISELDENGEIKLHLNQGSLTLPSTVTTKLFNAGYRKIRPVMVYPEVQDRIVLAQGVLTNTLAFNHFRKNNAPFSLVDWAFRPTWVDKSPVQGLDPGAPPFEKVLSHGHLMNINSELECLINTTADEYITSYIQPISTNSNPYQLFSDENIVNLWSPDIQYNPSLRALLTPDLTCNFVGLVHIGSSVYNQAESYGTYTSAGIQIKRNNYDSFPIELISNQTGGEQAVRFFTPHPKYQNTDKLDLAYFKTSPKIYGLFNTMFKQLSSLRYEINRPLYCDSADSAPVLPYPTNKVDNNGTIIYAKHLDETLIHNFSTISGRPTSTRIGLTSNSHLIFSLKDIGNEIKFSPIIPGFTSAGGVGTIIQEPESSPSLEGKVLIYATQGLLEQMTYRIENNRYLASFKIALRVNQLDNMGDLDTITIQPRLVKRQYLAENTIVITPEENAGAPITLTKAQYLALLDYPNLPEQKALPIIDVDLGTAGEYIDGAWVYEENDIVSYAAQYPQVTGTPLAKFLVNYEATGGEGMTGGGALLTDYYYNTIPYYRNNLTGYGYVKRMVNLSSVIEEFEGNGTSKKLLYLPLVELTRSETVEVLNSLYGGKTAEALSNNLWIPAGKAVKINNPNNTLTITYTEGDTYVQRYDCLKVQPSSESERNKVTSVLSFLCETYVNLDGRYDRNRYNADISNMRFTNYGLLNSGYSQSNNYFNYRVLDSRLFSVNKFPNQLVWSRPKSNGELVDTWANINLASIANLEGDLGNINKLINYNGNLLAFQDKGIAMLLFNSRVQIQTSDNVPIEIANSGRFEGYRYITNQSGCSNKEAIANTQQGVYYIDALNKSLMCLTFGDQGLINLSEQFGMNHWSKTNLNNNFKINVDNLNKDVYFLNSQTCLCFSELLQSFSGFFSYYPAYSLFNFKDKWLSIKNAIHTELYLNNGGIYNNFYGTLYPTIIEYKINPDMHLDKVFNTIEYRADMFNGNILDPFKTFTSIAVTNEYQDSGTTPLVLHKNLFKKFRIWRANIPRQVNSLNRIRNPWIKLKLDYTPASNTNYKLVLHDIIINYTI